MHSVGRHLQIHAQNNADPDRDAFARSAYNRYYYACYLQVREALVSMNFDVKQLSHKSIPDLLGASVVSYLKRERRRAEMLGDSELVGLINAAIPAISRLASLLKEAYGLRVVADYRPEVPIEFDPSSRFSLTGIGITKADLWASTTQTLLRTITRAWEQSYEC